MDMTYNYDYDLEIVHPAIDEKSHYLINRSEGAKFSVLCENKTDCFEIIERLLTMQSILNKDKKDDMG